MDIVRGRSGAVIYRSRVVTKGRPLGISNFEDKIVEQRQPNATLEPIYEAVFEDSSYGYRPGRSQHQCLDALGEDDPAGTEVNHVVEADISKVSLTRSITNGWSNFCVIRIGDRACHQANHPDAKKWHHGRWPGKAPRKRERRKAPFSRRCCRISTCTTCWTCGSAERVKQAESWRSVLFSFRR